MGNVFLFLLISVGSVLSEPTVNLVTELFAKDAVLQDREGLGAAGAAPPGPGAKAVTQPASAAAPPATIFAVLASAPSASPDPRALDIQPPNAQQPNAQQRGPAAAPSPVPPPSPTLTRTRANAAAPDITALPSAALLALSRDTPTRRPDGSVFLPVTVQHLIGLRTEITRVEQLSAAVQIPGRVVTSRDVGALIQSTQSGVLQAAETSVLRIGMRVTRGQLLAYQRPILDAVRTAELNAKMAELEGLIDMGEQRIVRLREVMFIRYRQSKIEAVQAEISSYRRQLQIYRGLLNDRIEIRAQSAGVISRVNFVAGQIVEPQTTLFEIVDPTRLWVEAAAFDPGLVEDIESAQAITGDGKVLQLRFSGGGLTLQNQAVPLQFEVVGPVTDIQIGKPVTVVVRRRQAQARGIRLPAEAIVHGASGETVVWQRLSAEAFMSRPVQAMPLDGTSVVITSGLTENMRIVTASSAMLAQVR